MIRTSKLSSKLTNKLKQDKLSLFINEYKKVVEYYVNLLWDNLSEKYECPKFISTKDYKNNVLSQRAIKCASMWNGKRKYGKSTKINLGCQQ